uniref:non-specific serine/threonine protein kinase n=1 Tax=Alexandrium monilatum TaxID=311494 RepID=A0A7S4V7Z9_9DINO
MEEEYFRGPLLGEGAFGEVYRMLHKKLGVERVVKVIQKEQLTVAEMTAADEVDALKTLDHPNVVRIYEAFEMCGSLHIVMDYAEGGDLGSLLRDLKVEGKLVPEWWARAVTQQICGALEYMHAKGVVHCDLKPANTMLLRHVDPLADEAPHVLLVDFGIAEMCQERSVSGSAKVKGTPHYLAPEAFDGNYSEKTDMWALGVILFEMFQGERPFNSEGPNILLLWSRITSSEPKWDGIPPLAQQVAKGLLAKDPINRLTAKECRTEEWFEIGTPLRMVKREQARISLQSIGHVSYFRRAAMFAVATGLSMKDMQHLFEVFQSLDDDDSGSLTLEQFARGLELTGIQQDPETLLAILDMDQNGSISYTEFLAGVIGTNSEGTISENAVREAFEMFDLDGDGSISAQELRIVLSGDGPLVEVLPDGYTIDDVMEQVGEGGQISFDNFMAFMRRMESSPSTAPARHFRRQASARFAMAMMQDLDGSLHSMPPSPVNLLPVPQRHKRAMVHDAPEVPQAHTDIQLPPLHNWLLDACGKPHLRDVLMRFLQYPGEALKEELVSEHLYSLSRHFLACIALCRQLAQHPAAEQDGALQVAVAAAAATHAARRRPPPSVLQPLRAAAPRSHNVTPLRPVRKGAAQPRQGRDLPVLCSSKARPSSRVRPGALSDRVERRAGSKNSDTPCLPRLPPAAAGAPARRHSGSQVTALPNVVAASRRPHELRRPGGRLPWV